MPVTATEPASGPGPPFFWLWRSLLTFSTPHFPLHLQLCYMLAAASPPVIVLAAASPPVIPPAAVPTHPMAPPPLAGRQPEATHPSRNCTNCILWTRFLYGMVQSLLSIDSARMVSTSKSEPGRPIIGLPGLANPPQSAPSRAGQMGVWGITHPEMSDPSTCKHRKRRSQPRPPLPSVRVFGTLLSHFLGGGLSLCFLAAGQGGMAHHHSVPRWSLEQGV